MQRWRLVLLIVGLALLLTACVPYSDSQIVSAPAAQLPVVAQNTALADICPVTRPPEPRFTPPPPYSRYAPSPGEFWYGTDSLWTAIPGDGVWSALPHNPEGYTQKVFWWREGYSLGDESHLSVTGRRLDAPAPPLNVSRATNAFAEDIGSAMLVGVDFPTPGCWEITGRYASAELSFVIWVAP
jgi:hypothetical protein